MDQECSNKSVAHLYYKIYKLKSLYAKYFMYKVCRIKILKSDIKIFFYNKIRFEILIFFLLYIDPLRWKFILQFYYNLKY